MTSRISHLSGRAVRRMAPRPTVLASLMGLAFASPQVWAQASTQENDPRFGAQTITVTATKRAQTIQEVPFSVNAQTAADIEKTGATSIEDISRSVAGLTVQNLGPGQSQVS